LRKPCRAQSKPRAEPGEYGFGEPSKRPVQHDHHADLEPDNGVTGKYGKPQKTKRHVANNRACHQDEGRAEDHGGNEDAPLVCAARAPMRDLLSLAELKALKAKQRKAKDPITREWCAALLEGAKASPWYSDDNMPSLYRDRGMKIAAVAVIAIDKRHGLATEGLQFLRRFHLQLPNTFATLPAVVRDWEAQFSLRVASGCPGEITLRNPEEGAEQNGLNEWLDQHLVRLEKCGIMA
jgi:hypothetical protein